jgi:Uncharacterized protein conserved in bacteria (DUF2252)
MAIRSVHKITDDYEAWMRERLPFVLENHLEYKHDEMAGRPGHEDNKRDTDTAFRFLRATFYLWAYRLRERLPQLVEDVVPRVLGVGDIHLENFGTWRDAEGRQVWGVNDVDEAAVLPCTNDLVRLVTSARLADLEVHGDDAASAVLSGYREQLAMGARPFVLAEQEEHLWKLARDQSAHPERWWRERQHPDPLPPRALFGNVTELLRGDFPDAHPDIFALGTRRAGLGSLGRPRVVALARWYGSLVCREAKAVLPSAWDWADGVRNAKSHARGLLSSPTRAPDPYTKVIDGWSIRRLAPDSGGIDIDKIDHVDDQRALLRSMGSELANIHLTQTNSAVLLEYVQPDPQWLADAARTMATAVREDHAEYSAR